MTRNIETVRVSRDGDEDFVEVYMPFSQTPFFLDRDKAHDLINKISKVLCEIEGIV